MLPNSVRMLPQKSSEPTSEAAYIAAVAQALRKHLGNTRCATKRVMGWTGASESTVKNWFAGTRGPNGLHLIGLIRNSDELFESVLELAERRLPLRDRHLTDAREKLLDVLKALGQKGG